MTLFENLEDDRVPEQIRERLRRLREEVDTICDTAMGNIVTDVPRMISYRVSGEASERWGGDLMPAEERAQAVSFVVKYEHLPDDVKVIIGPVGNGWHIKNLWELRHTLNDFRPIIQNQNDLTFYANVNATIQKRLRRTTPADGLRLQAFEGNSENEVTLAYAAHLAEHRKAIASILGALEYGYLFNGVLQHSDPTYSRRFLRDYTSGEFNYILWKHVIVLGQIQYWLRHYYAILKVLNFPSLGSLDVRPPDR